MLTKQARQRGDPLRQQRVQFGRADRQRLGAIQQKLADVTTYNPVVERHHRCSHDMERAPSGSAEVSGGADNHAQALLEGDGAVRRGATAILEGGGRRSAPWTSWWTRKYTNP